MTLYSLLRLLHGYWRWAVVIAGAIVLLRSLRGWLGKKGWERGDEVAAKAFVGTVDLQFLFGVVLYFFLSPFFSAVWNDFALSMQHRATRFFGIEHQVAMFLAVSAAHIGKVRALRATEPAQRHRILAITLLVFTALILMGVPWSWRGDLARPLFRTEW